MIGTLSHVRARRRTSQARMVGCVLFGGWEARARTLPTRTHLGREHPQRRGEESEGLRGRWTFVVATRRPLADRFGRLELAHPALVELVQEGVGAPNEFSRQDRFACQGVYEIGAASAVLAACDAKLGDRYLRDIAGPVFAVYMS